MTIGGIPSNVVSSPIYAQAIKPFALSLSKGERIKNSVGCSVSRYNRVSISAKIMRLVRNHGLYERAERPLKRIMEGEEKEGATLLATTDVHLARSIGELLRHAYRGGLE